MLEPEKLNAQEDYLDDVEESDDEEEEENENERAFTRMVSVIHNSSIINCYLRI